MRSLSFLALAALVAVGCATPDQRYFYRSAIDQFSPKLPKAGVKCWVTPDLVGPGSGSNAIAEEVFTNYLLDKNLCEVVEKHPDALAGYTWPKDDICPCQAGVAPCNSACPAAGGAMAVPSLGGFGGGGGSGEGNDNDRSHDKLLERFKKHSLPQKLIIYRIDELKPEKAVIWFRIADARTTAVESSQTVVIEKVTAPPRE